MSNKKIQVTYFNNRINFKGLPDVEKTRIRELWIELREDYADWVAEVRLKDFGLGKPLVELLEWNGMSTWWLNNLVRKESEDDPQWLHRLMILYFCNKYVKNVTVETDDPIIVSTLKKNFPNIRVTLRYAEGNLKTKIKSKYPLLWMHLILSKSLFRSLKVWLLTYGFSIDRGVYSDQKKHIWFTTMYPANWIKDDDEGWYDRQLKDAPLKDHQYGMKTSYLVYVIQYLKYKKISLFKLRKELAQLERKARRHVFFPESRLGIKDIFKTYLGTYQEYLRFKRWKQQKRFLDLFTLAGMDVSTILLDHWGHSYFGLMQYCKLRGLATMYFLRMMQHRQAIVNYAEFFIETRADYHLKNLTVANATFYALQHSQESRNYGEAYNRKSEFSQNGSLDHVHYCPTPDWFLAHGEQYQHILSEFYPSNRIQIIGSLKVKQYIKNVKQANRNSIPNNPVITKSKKADIVVALSSNDAWFLFQILSKWDPKEDLQIMMTIHPANNLKQIKAMIANDLSHLNIRLVTGTSTWELLPSANALICGYSNLIYEALLFRIPTAVLQPIGVFSPREIDPRIPIFYDAHSFDKWLNETLAGGSVSDLVNESESMFYEFYYHPDGKADERMWDHIIKTNLI